MVLLVKTSLNSGSSSSNSSPMRLIRDEGGVGNGTKGGLGAGALYISFDHLCFESTYPLVLVFLVLWGVNSPSAAADFHYLGVTCTEDMVEMIRSTSLVDELICRPATSSVLYDI